MTGVSASSTIGGVLDRGDPERAIDNGDGPERVCELYRAFARRDLAALAQVLAGTVVWVEAGEHAFAGTYRGRDQVADHLAGLVRETRGSYILSLLDVYAASAQRLVVRQREVGQRLGRRLDSESCLLVEVATEGIVGVERFDADISQRNRFFA
jgi:ketosteroid isomerase-like protein